MVALSRNIPRKQSFEMLTTGAFIDAARGTDLGLINRAVPAENLTDDTMQLATTVAAKLGGAVRIGKRAFHEQSEAPLEQAYLHTGAAMTENMMLEDSAEGIAAFLGKRAPDWSQ